MQTRKSCCAVVLCYNMIGKLASHLVLAKDEGRTMLCHECLLNQNQATGCLSGLTE